MIRRLVAFLAVAVVLGGAAPAGADERMVSEARAHVTTDNASAYAWDFDVERDYDEDVVDPLNLAEAYGKCTGCRAVAISFQVVIVTERPTTVVPENYAVAVNDQCTSCDVRAGAFQFVRGGEGMVLTDRGYAKLMHIKQLFRGAMSAGGRGDDLMARAQRYADEIRLILAQEVVKGSGDVGEEDRAQA